MHKPGLPAAFTLSLLLLFRTSAHGENPDSSDIGTQAGLQWLWMYQNVFSPFIPSDCRMEPSCSQFSVEALQKYGPVLGVMLTADRLLHEQDERRFAPKHWNPWRGIVYSDPVENNVPAENRDADTVIAANTGLSIAPPVSSPEDIENILEFANHLMREGDYDRAITEYKRFIFISSDHIRVPEARFRMAVAYLLSGRTDTGLSLLKALTAQTGHPTAIEAQYKLAGALYSNDRFSEAYAEGKRLEALTESGPGLPHLFTSLCLLRMGDAATASTSLRSGSYDTTLQQHADTLARSADRYSLLPEKSPAFAGSLSALLPGAGQIYVERPHDAAWAFLLNSVFAGAAIAAFKNDEDIAGSFAICIGAVWYSGNIYNAMNGARKFNKRVKNAFYEEVDRDCFNEKSPLLKFMVDIPF